MSAYDLIAGASMLAKDQHCNSHREWILQFSAKMHLAGTLEKPWNGEISEGLAVLAEIDLSRWIARCPYCGHCEAVDPDEKIFFCMNCDMVDNKYMAMPVEFPEWAMLKEIEELLLQRPMKVIHGPTQYERIVRMQPLIYIQVGDQLLGLGRAWKPGETVEDLRKEQHEAILKWKADGLDDPKRRQPTVRELFDRKKKPDRGGAK